MPVVCGAIVDPICVLQLMRLACRRRPFRRAVLAEEELLDDGEQFAKLELQRVQQAVRHPRVFMLFF